MPPPLLSRRKKWLLGISITLLLLGMGNLLFAHYKLREYSAISANAMHKDASAPPPRWLPSELGKANTTARQGEKVRTRIEYYELTERGGAAFVAIGLVILFFSFMGKEPAPQ